MRPPSIELAAQNRGLAKYATLSVRIYVLNIRQIESDIFAVISAGVFRALRESNLRLLESVPPERWVECYGVHEVRGWQTVEEFVRLEAALDLNHLRQIDRIG
jgi:hypothetical protein